MRDPLAQLRRDQRRGERAVIVAIDQHQLGAELDRDRLQPLHRGGGLLGVRARADAEVIVGCRDPLVFEEAVRQLGIVALAGVHNDVLHIAALG